MMMSCDCSCVNNRASGFTQIYLHTDHSPCVNVACKNSTLDPQNHYLPNLARERVRWNDVSARRVYTAHCAVHVHTVAGVVLRYGAASKCRRI